MRAIPAQDWAVCGVVEMAAMAAIPEVDWVGVGIFGLIRVRATSVLHMGGR